MEEIRSVNGRSSNSWLYVLLFCLVVLIGACVFLFLRFLELEQRVEECESHRTEAENSFHDTYETLVALRSSCACPAAPLPRMAEGRTFTIPEDLTGDSEGLPEWSEEEGPKDPSLDLTDSDTVFEEPKGS